MPTKYAEFMHCRVLTHDAAASARNYTACQNLAEALTKRGICTSTLRSAISTSHTCKFHRTSWLALPQPHRNPVESFIAEFLSFSTEYIHIYCKLPYIIRQTCGAKNQNNFATSLGCIVVVIVAILLRSSFKLPRFKILFLGDCKQFYK